MKHGLSGALTAVFIRSPLTPLMLLAALAVGLMALASLPREEEPQISVPMVDIVVSADGLKAADAAELVTKPLEQIIKGIDGVEHVYSRTEDDRMVVTARFLVGTSADDAILRVHAKVRANFDRKPLGIPEPLIVGRGINDVAILVLTLSPRPEAAERWTDAALYTLAADLQAELVKESDVGLSYLVGGRPDQIRVEPDPERLALLGVTLNQLVDKVRHANRSFLVGALREPGTAGGGIMLPVAAGQTLGNVADIGQLLLTTHDGRPVYVKDVARVVVGARPDEQRVWHMAPDGKGGLTRVPAVSLAIAKRAGTNAVLIADRVLKRLATVRGRLIPDGIDVTVTRDYGRSADDKVNELLFHLVLATISIVALVGVAVGRREAMVVLVVIPTTILLTLFASWLLGYTINRVSLFALIFSIGILVDDAIVVVENIGRHWAMDDGRSRLQAAVEAVSEVGNPTIVATLTVIAALLPMMFVSGLMGPYMSPIPANASAAMLFSFLVAVIVAPWLMLRVSGPAPHAGAAYGEEEGRLGRLYRRLAAPLLATRRRTLRFLTLVGGLTVLSVLPFATRTVTVKLLPFDNKSELQVTLDRSPGASLEDTERLLFAAADRLASLPELQSVQLQAGTAAAFDFNGLVRHSYLRRSPEIGDLQLNLLPKDKRSRASHAVALDVRERLRGLALPAGAVLKVVEVPPGPPVLATLLAEIYAPDAGTRRAVARKVREAFAAVPFVTDIDDSFGQPGERLRFALDHESLEFHGVEEQAVYDTLAALLGGVSVGYSHRGANRTPVEIAVRLPPGTLFSSERLLTTPVPGARGPVELGDLVHAVREPASWPLFRRDGRYAELVTAELAGAFEAPIYGMAAVADQMRRMSWETGTRPDIALHGQPADESRPTLLWDGEWEITYVTFRDMGAAFAVALVGIYLLVVAQFGSFRLPLVILLPVPLTLIGIVPGHWLLGAPFTATSMIGFIALAGIIVRNSILLVDFIRHGQERAQTEGRQADLAALLLEAGAIRVKPILLTALAAMIGAAFILTDPIFQGLAISLLFGLASSTVLTVLVIPAVYMALRGREV